VTFCLDFDDHKTYEEEKGPDGVAERNDEAMMATHVELREPRKIRVALAYNLPTSEPTWLEKFKRETGLEVVHEGKPEFIARKNLSLVDAVVLMTDVISHKDDAIVKNAALAAKRPLIRTTRRQSTWEVFGHIRAMPEVDVLVSRKEVSSDKAPLTASIFDMAEAKKAIAEKKKDFVPVPPPPPLPVPSTPVLKPAAISQPEPAAATEPRKKGNPDFTPVPKPDDVVLEEFLRMYAELIDGGLTQKEIVPMMTWRGTAVRDVNHLNRIRKQIVGKKWAPKWYLEWMSADPHTQAIRLARAGRLQEESRPRKRSTPPPPSVKNFVPESLPKEKILRGERVEKVERDSSVGVSSKAIEAIRILAEEGVIDWREAFEKLAARVVSGR